VPFAQEILLLNVGADEHTYFTYHTNRSNFKMKHFPAEKLVANINAIIVELY
jgi:hypothetical protein